MNERKKKGTPLIHYVTFMPMAADVIPHKHSVATVVIITVTGNRKQFTIHNQLPIITICGSCDLLNYNK